MKKYILFCSNHNREGGPFDIEKIFNDLDSTFEYGKNIFGDCGSIPNDTIVRISVLDCETNELKYLAKLNIPNTEYDETGVLEWVMK